MTTREEMEALLGQYEALTIELERLQQQFDAGHRKVLTQMTRLGLEKQQLSLRYRMHELQQQLSELTGEW